MKQTIITDINQLDPNGSYTYADYITWQFEEMVELIKGKIYPRISSPPLKHQRISVGMIGQVYRYVRQSTYELFPAPSDVVLYDGSKSASKKKEVNTVVQPDLFVVCNTEKLDGQVCNGSPDWIIEILSPGTQKRDLTLKFNLYEENGVREYWIMSAADETLQKFMLNENTMKFEFAGNYAEGKVQVGIFPELYVDLGEVFE